MQKYLCDICGYVYDPEAGDPDRKNLRVKTSKPIAGDDKAREMNPIQRQKRPQKKPLKSPLVVPVRTKSSTTCLPV